jgi:hypothetical protein
MKKSHISLTITAAALLWGAALIAPAGSLAASCCGGGSATALNVPKYARAVADLSLDTELYDGYWNKDGNHRPDPPNSDLKQYRLNMGLGYRLAKDWQVSASLPYVWNDNRYSGISSQTDGLGDSSFSVIYELLDDNSSWKVRDAQDLIPAVSMGVSILLPTGLSPYDDVKSSFDVTGRGFYRLDGTLLIEKTIRPWSASVAISYGTHFERSVNREYGKFIEPYTKQLGDRFNVTAAGSYAYVLGTGGDSVTGTLSYAYLDEGDASFNGRRDIGSGFDKQSVGGALAYSSTDHNWSVRMGWNHAIQQSGWGQNFPATDILSVGVRYVFL